MNEGDIKPEKRIKRGKWDEFFDFELPELFYERKEGPILSFSLEIPSDQEKNLPISTLEINLYNPAGKYELKVLKAKLFFDKEKKLEELDKEFYWKQAERSFDQDEILRSIGPEVKLIVARSRIIHLEIKDPSEYLFQSVFSFFQEKLKEYIPSMERQLLDYLRKDDVKINNYISLKLEDNLCKVYCNEKYFWTFIPKDIKHKECIDFYELKISYEDWFKNMYLPQANDKINPKKYEFSDYCHVFKKWNDNNLKNKEFVWHFYSHLMSSLIEAGHPKAMEIYREEKKKSENQYKYLLKKKDGRRVIQEGKLNDFFDFNIPDRIFKEREYQTSSCKRYHYDNKQMVPRSIIELTIYIAKHPSDKLFKVKYYLERSDEMREIEYEEASYFKYWEFLEEQRKILNIIGEELKLITYLDGSTSLSFSNSDFFPKEIIFSDFKIRLKEILQEIKKKNN